MANGVTILLAILPFTTSQTEKDTPRSLSCLSLLKPKMGYEVVEERTLWLYHFTFYSHGYVSQYHYHFSKCSLGRFPFNPKFRKVKLVHQMEQTISVWSDRNIRDQLWRSVGPKCPFPFDKIVVPSTALLYPACKNNNQTRGGLGRVCATGMYRFNGNVKFRKFQAGVFVEWKAPLVMSVVLMFYRITREVNPGLTNFRNLAEQQFLLGAIGSLSGKQISDTLISKFRVLNYKVTQWNTF